MIPDKKQNSNFSDTDLAKAVMQDTHQQQVHPSPSSSSTSSSSSGDSKDWHGSSESSKSRTSGGNTTERVPVASSEHVAEIVGRQGSKIKALRAKTNTYIKTPVRGEEPVFVVTGRADDVIAAKMEILSVAEHFDHVMALNKARPLPAPPSESDGDGNGCPDSSANHVTVRVRVPYRVVGLLVGPKGATIKRIQLDSQTYIVTPSRDKEPIFEITGTPENVERAKAEIEGYIALRTGIADLAPLQHQSSAMSPQLHQQQQQQLSKFLLPSINDFSALLHGPANASPFNALQILNSINGSTAPPADFYGTGPFSSIGQQPVNPQIMNAATLLGTSNQPMLKSPGKGVFWPDIKTDQKTWPSAISDILGSGLPPWFSATHGTGQRHMVENGMRKMSLGSCRETPVCVGKSYHDDLFDPTAVLNPSSILGVQDSSPLLSGNGSISDLCNYDRFNNAFSINCNNNNNNGNNNTTDNHLNRNNNYLNALLNSSNNKNISSVDQKLLATILALKQNGYSLPMTPTSLLQQQQQQPFGNQIPPFNCCDLTFSDINNNNSCTNCFGCLCPCCSGSGQLDYPRNPLLYSSMMTLNSSPHNPDSKVGKSKDDSNPKDGFQNPNSALSSLNFFPTCHVFNDSGGKQNPSPYLSHQRDGDSGLSFIMSGERAQDDALRFSGIDSGIMAFSDISSNSNSSSSSSPTDVIERTAY